MHIIPVMEFVDFFEELSRRNLLHLLDRICVLAGYSSTLSCLTVCRRWSSILTEDLGSWTGILQRELRRNPENVGKIAALLGWDQPGSNISQAQAFWIHTDVKDIFRRYRHNY